VRKDRRAYYRRKEGKKEEGEEVMGSQKAKSTSPFEA
jgi:hypothetical protein